MILTGNASPSTRVSLFEEVWSSQSTQVARDVDSACPMCVCMCVRVWLSVWVDCLYSHSLTDSLTHSTVHTWWSWTTHFVKLEEFDCLDDQSSFWLWETLSWRKWHLSAYKWSSSAVWEGKVNYSLTRGFGARRSLSWLWRAPPRRLRRRVFFDSPYPHPCIKA